MLKNKRQNFHHSKLPEIGSVGYINNNHRKCIVVAYPLCDNTLPYSIGIHTCFVRFLDNGRIERFSGFLFKEW